MLLGDPSGPHPAPPLARWGCSGAVLCALPQFPHPRSRLRRGHEVAAAGCGSRPHDHPPAPKRFGSPPFGSPPPCPPRGCGWPGRGGAPPCARQGMGALCWGLRGGLQAVLCHGGRQGRENWGEKGGVWGLCPLPCLWDWSGAGGLRCWGGGRGVPRHAAAPGLTGKERDFALGARIGPCFSGGQAGCWAGSGPGRCCPSLA